MPRLKELIRKNPDVAVHFFKLLIAHNALMSLYRKYVQPALESECARGRGFKSDKQIYYLLSVGIMKEALDAFRQVNQCHPFVPRELSNDKDFQLRRRLLEEAADKGNRNSFYSRYVKTIRDEAAFHWNGVSQYLTELAKKPDKNWPQLLDTPSVTPKSWEVIFPIADDFLHRYAQKNTSSESIPEDVNKMFKVSDALCFYVQSIIQRLA